MRVLSQHIELYKSLGMWETVVIIDPTYYYIAHKLDNLLDSEHIPSYRSISLTSYLQRFGNMNILKRSK